MTALLITACLLVACCLLCAGYCAGHNAGYLRRVKDETRTQMRVAAVENERFANATESKERIWS